jgi:ferrochelatase
MSEVDGVLLIAFGGPGRPEDVGPFLETVAAGRRIPPDRLEEVARHYAQIGGRSPLADLTRAQARALEAALGSEGRALPVHVGMRNWHPFLHETLSGLQGAGHRRVLGVIMSPFQTEASWDRYVGDVAAARDKVGPGAPEVVFARAWADHPLFVRAMAERVEEALGALPAPRRAAAQLIFTAHSVPVAMAQESPYTAQFEGAARVVAGRAGHARWALAYQSRSGSPRDPWLEPDVGDAIRAAAGAGATDVVVAPIGFVCDHVEVLYDLDVEARAIARELGVAFHRAAAANAHPTFIAMLADVVRRALGR